MTTNQTYESFILQINANATTDNLSCDKGKFVVMYNQEQNRFIENLLDRKFEDDIRYLQQILVSDKEIPSSNSRLNATYFDLPKNYFDFSNVYALASKGKCQKQKFDLFEIKDDDRNLILFDSNNQPSWKYRESPFSIQSKQVKVYKDETFNLDKILLSYYRYPQQIGLIDYEDPESNFNANNPEWDDKANNRIIDLTVSSFFLQMGDQRFQVEKQNAIQK